jgi:hypothetical protein
MRILAEGGWGSALWEYFGAAFGVEESLKAVVEVAVAGEAAVVGRLEDH